MTTPTTLAERAAAVDARRATAHAAVSGLEQRAADLEAARAAALIAADFDAADAATAELADIARDLVPARAEVERLDAAAHAISDERLAAEATARRALLVEQRNQARAVADQALAEARAALSTARERLREATSHDNEAARATVKITRLDARVNGQQLHNIAVQPMPGEVGAWVELHYAVVGPLLQHLGEF